MFPYHANEHKFNSSERPCTTDLRTVPTFVTVYMFCATRNASIALDAHTMAGICSIKMMNSTTQPRATKMQEKIILPRNQWKNNVSETTSKLK